MSEDYIPPAAPEALDDAGRAMWEAVAGTFRLEPHELELLRQACATADVVARLEAVVADEGDMSESSQGPRVHPALVEARQQRGMLAKQIAALRLPDPMGDHSADDDAHGDPGADSVTQGWPQRRVGVRGFYAIAGDA